jgi:hypothetical protein
VTVIGEDEKQAFTIVVSVSNSGELLLFQAMYQKYSSKTCPSNLAKDYDVVIGTEFCFEYSKSKTYWSTHETMHLLVNNSILLYFAWQKAKLSLPPSQKAIWQIDVWSVDCLKEFYTWMLEHHPNIMVDFVPGGCTPVWQACDTGIQQIFKHSQKWSYHEDIVSAMLKQMEDKANIIQGDKTWVCCATRVYCGSGRHIRH